MWTFLITSLILLIIFLPIPVKVSVGYINNNFFLKIYNKKINFKKKEIQKREFKKINFTRVTKSIIKSKFKINIKANLNLTYGFGDAAQTAIFYGILYNLYILFFKTVELFFKIKDFKFNPIPDFKNKILNFKFESIFFISLAKIIYILAIVIKNI